MSHTYTAGGSDSISRVRFAIGAVQPTPTTISDEEITGLVTAMGSWQGAVAEVFWRRHADMSREASSASTADGSRDYSASLSALAEQARRWEREAAAAATTPSDLPLAVVGTMGAYDGSPCGLWRIRG